MSPIFFSLAEELLKRRKIGHRKAKEIICQAAKDRRVKRVKVQITKLK